MLVTLLSGALFFSTVDAYEACDIVAPEYCPTSWSSY